MAKDKTERKGVTMVAPAADKGGGLHPVEMLAEAAGLKPWKLAGLLRAQRWADGKQVTPAEFAAALARFEQRPMGGGKL